MPMGIAPYTTYNILDVLAPELKGLWKMTKIPGTKKVDGTINRAETSSGTASVLMERSKDKQSAFSFLDWWTSDRIQAKFGIEIEGLMGPAARYNVANIKSLEMLPWQTNEYNMLMEQWKTVYAVPQIPSSYDVTRNVTNAFRNVVYYNYNEREILNKYAKYIDTEIERKNKEYRNKLRKP
jgi:ABC-type glycerol-3-phosphate transport system substrate-binding protein